MKLSHHHIYSSDTMCIMRICILSIFILILEITPLKSQVLNQNFIPEQLVHLNTEQGLSHSGVTSLLHDTKGYLWVGTYDGLCRYNGNNIVVFKNQVNKNILCSNRIRSLIEDSKSNIWIGTDEGVILYDTNTSKFRNLAKPSNTHSLNNFIVIYIYQSDATKSVFCYTNNGGILEYNLQGRLLKYYRLEIDNINKIVPLTPTKHLIASSTGLYLFDYVHKRLTHVLPNAIKVAYAIALSGKNSLLVSLETGIKKLNYSIIGNNIIFTAENSILYPENRYVDMCYDDNHNLWLGTLLNGILYQSNRTVLGKSPLVPILDKKRISSILNLHNGIMWVATFDDGLYCYSSKNNVFKKFIYTEKDLNVKIPWVLNYDKNHCIAKLSGSNVGLFDIHTGLQQELPFNLPKPFISMPTFAMGGMMPISTIAFDSNKVFTIKNNSIKQSQMPYINANKLKDYRCYLWEDESHLWMGYSNDLLRATFDKDGNVVNIESILKNPYFKNRRIENVRVIYKDNITHSILVGSETQGFYSIRSKSANINDANIKQHKHDINDKTSLSSNFVSAFCRHPDGTLYVGTEQGGLCKAEKSGDKFKIYSEDDGLSNNTIKSLICDNSGSLWVATNIGLNKFDTKTGQFQTFRLIDGLPFEEFWYNSLKTLDGTLIFSGLDDVLFFNPKELLHNEPLPNIVFVGLKLPKDVQSSQDNQLNHNDSGCDINLDYDQNSFSVKLDVLYEKPASGHKIKYQLLPSSDKWITLSASTGEIQFTGLPSGKYQLNVKASNSFDEWTEPSQLNIVINPPFYKTTIAYIIYLILFVLAIYGINRVIIRFKLLHHKLDMEMFKANSIREMNEEKQRYFYNISHELKTPLTLISAPIDLLIDRFSSDEEVNKKLQIIKRQGKKILQLIDTALGSRLEDLSLLKKDESVFKFNKLFNELMTDFVFLAKFDKRNFIYQLHDEEIYVNADRSMIEKIFNNLLNNAFKYTKEDDEINIDCTTNENNLIIKIKDTGIGIQAEDIPNIFKRFYQGKNSAKIGGTGIGLSFTKCLVELHNGTISVDSEPNVGTTFTIVLPILATENDYVPAAETTEIFKDDDVKKQILAEDNFTEYTVDEKIKDSLVYVVEDNVMMRNFLVELISQLFKVESFADGKECIEAMQDNWPNIIVSDVMMPNMDGYEFCKHVKSNFNTSHIPVILLTACGSIDQKLTGLECGADSYIPKPFYPRHLVKRIETLLYSRVILCERYQIGVPLALDDNSSIRTKDNEFMETLYRICSENICNEDMDIKSVITELGMSRSSFFQKVKVLTNLTPNQLFKNYKLKRAAELLQKNDANVNEVCIMVGFKSRSSFSRLFKEKYGVSPSKYIMDDKGL